MKQRKTDHFKKKPFISIIVPAYRAEKTIKKNLLEVKEVMDDLKKPYEIICVVDGTVDNTEKEAKKVEEKHPKKVKVFSYLTNLGKGHAVRFGMAKAKGDIIGFLDAGLEINPDAIPLIIEHMNWYEADAIIASKRHQASRVEYPWQRRLLSFGYQLLVRVLFGLKVKDTQVGLKVFKRELLEKVMPRLMVKEFAFDIEILSVAGKLGYKKIFEAPVEMRMIFGSSTIASKGFRKTILKMLTDTLAVFYRLKIKKYYDIKNKKYWITPKYLTLDKKK